MKRQRIVLVFLEPPLPFGAAVGRWFSVLYRGLIERGHDVTAFAACSKITELEEARRLYPAKDFDLRLYPFPVRKGWKSKLETLRRPYSYMFADDLKRDLSNELVKGFDILHLEQPWSGWLGLNHAEKAVLSVLNLYAIDATAHPPQGWREWLNRRLLLGAEAKLLRSYPRFTALSDRLKEVIRTTNPQADVSVVPLGIDASLYPYIPDDKRGSDPVIGLVGNMGWSPSVTAARRLLSRLWPRILAEVPNAKVRIVGWNARGALAEFLDRPGVEILENVPETRPYFEASSLLLYAPERGSGMKVKVLEAMGYGVPVVTTLEGVEGLPATDGVEAGIAEDDAGLAARAIALLNDPAMQNRQRAAARRLLETHCGPKPTLDKIEAVYARMISRES